MTEVSSSKKNSDKSAPKKNNKSRHYNQTTWSFGPGKIKPHSEEYNTVMHDLFGEGGFPLERDYSVQSATVGMSLFEEKDETDINEMKSKVLQRASAVLIMRPRSANASQAQLLHRQKAMLGSGRASKLPKGKSQKKLTAAQTDRKALTDNAKSDLDIKLDKRKSNEASRKGSLSDTTKVEKIPAESKKHSDLPLPEKHSELDAAALKKTAAEEKATGSSNSGPAADVKDTDEDVTDILARFSQRADTETKPHHGLFVTNTHRPLSNRSWDKSAVPKPWDKWASLRKQDVNNKSAKSNKPLTADPRAPHSSPKALLKTSTKPSTGKSWQPSSPVGKAAPSNEKRPQSAGMPARRPSWARQLSTEAELPQKSTEHPDLDPQAWNLPVSKRKAVVDWLDKHVNSSREEEPTSPSSSSSSVFDTDAGNTLLSANNLAEVTAQAAGVESYEISTRVSAWLSSLGLKNVDVYEQMFAKHQIDMVDVPSLTVPVLQQIGISKLGPVMKIMRGVDRLKAGLSKTTKKLKQLEDFDHPGKFKGLHKHSSRAGENQNSVHSEAATGVLNSKSQADRPVENKELQEGHNMRNSSDKASEEKNMSPAERAENLQSSLQELYRQLAKEETSGHRCGDCVLLGNSRDTSPFECTHGQAEVFFSETSTNVPQLTSESDGSQRWRASQEGRTSQKMRHFSVPAEEAKEGGRIGVDQTLGRGQGLEGDSHKCSAAEGEMSYNSPGSGSKPKHDSDPDPGVCEERALHRAPFPQTDKIPPKAATGHAKKSAKASQPRSSGSVTKATGKMKDQPTSSKVKSQGDASLLRPASGKIDSGLCCFLCSSVHMYTIHHNNTVQCWYVITEEFIVYSAYCKWKFFWLTWPRLLPNMYTETSPERAGLSDS